MKKIMSLNIVTIITVAVMFTAIQLVLLHDSCIKSSISSIICLAHALTPKEHLLVLGLLPIYIGLVVFGSAMLGIYLGSNLQHFIFRRLGKTPSCDKKSA